MTYKRSIVTLYFENKPCYLFSCFVADLMAISVCMAIILVLGFLPINEGLCQEPSGQARHKENAFPENSENIIAKIGNSFITLVDLNEYLSYRAVSPASSITREAIRQRIEEMIISEALYQEAMKQGLHQDPKIKRIIRQVLTQRLMEDQVEKRVWTRPIEDQEIQSYYDTHAAIFNRPEEIRLADIFIALNQNASAEERTEKREKAESILTGIMQSKGTSYDFGELIIKYSDKHPQYPLGDTGFFDAQGRPLGLDPVLVKEAFALEGIGEICDHIIETPAGYHIIMLIEKRPAFSRPLEQVKGQIEQKIRKEELEKSRKEYMQGIKDHTEITINDNAIDVVFKKMKEHAQQETQSGDTPPFPLAPPPVFPEQLD